MEMSIMVGKTLFRYEVNIDEQTIFEAYDSYVEKKKLPNLCYQEQCSPKVSGFLVRAYRQEGLENIESLYSADGSYQKSIVPEIVLQIASKELPTLEWRKI